MSFAHVNIPNWLQVCEWHRGEHVSVHALCWEQACSSSRTCAPHAPDCVRVQQPLRAGAGHMQAHWVPDRGIVLLLYSDALMIYDGDLGTVLEHIALPRRCKPFVRWLDTRGSGGACLGAAADGQLATLVVEHEVRFHVFCWQLYSKCYASVTSWIHPLRVFVPAHVA